ncbi:MAG: carbamoyltransferase [Candidatus Dormibacteraeota bacterium]|nr:carbamoyltransferase [Candidatus Dormibacteraeota bacterium]
MRRAMVPGVIILGLNAFHGDASAALVVNGELVAAAEEERFTRVRHDASFPANAIRYCMDEADLGMADLDHVAVSHNPHAKFLRRAGFALAGRAGRRMLFDRTANIGQLLRVKKAVAETLEEDYGKLRARVHFVGHHHAHLASSFLVSPFENAALLSLDGFGDFVSARWGVGEGHRMRLTGGVGFPHSLGVFYSAVTQFLGFPKFGDEYKVMSLAPYGEPAYLSEMRRIVRSDGLRFKLDLDYFRHHQEGAAMTWPGGTPEPSPLWGWGMVRRFGAPRKHSDQPLEQRHQNVAASLQTRLEEVALGMLQRLHKASGSDALCLAGGVALNSVLNGKVLEQTPFRTMYIQPAANDAGSGLGAAFYVHNQVLGGARTFVMNDAYLGPAFGVGRCRLALEEAGVTFGELGYEESIERTARALAQGKVVGWFQGRMELGQQALGNRSILVDPRRDDMKEVLNARVKHREPFRPFALSILEEATGRFFERSQPSPFMLQTYRLRPGAERVIPAPTQVDGTGCVQTVRRDQNPRFYDLLRAFERHTGVPVLLNTSFNENEPICCTPEEAVETFLRSRMDVLVLGDLYAELGVPGIEARRSAEHLVARNGH